MLFDQCSPRPSHDYSIEVNEEMPTPNAAFVGSIPENYDRYLGPVLFDPYAPDLASRLNVSTDASVLELRCGPGIVTRRLRDRLGCHATLVDTDYDDAT